MTAAHSVGHLAQMSADMMDEPTVARTVSMTAARWASKRVEMKAGMMEHSTVALMVRTLEQRTVDWTAAAWGTPKAQMMAVRWADSKAERLGPQKAGWKGDQRAAHWAESWVERWVYSTAAQMAGLTAVTTVSQTVDLRGWNWDSWTDENSVVRLDALMAAKMAPCLVEHWDHSWAETTDTPTVGHSVVMRALPRAAYLV